MKSQSSPALKRSRPCSVDCPLSQRRRTNSPANLGTVLKGRTYPPDGTPALVLPVYRDPSDGGSSNARGVQYLTTIHYGQEKLPH